MLPVPCDYPVVALQSFNSNNPPYVPQVPLLPEGQALLVYASSAIANEVSARAQQTQARMFCYNMLSSDAWANAAFADVVKLTCDSAILKQRTGRAHTAAAVLVEAASEVLSLYTSMLVISYPDLARMLSPETVNAAVANHRIFVDLTNDTQTLYQQAAPYQQPPPPQSRFPMRNAIQRAPEAFSNPAGGSLLTSNRNPATARSVGPAAIPAAKPATQPTPATETAAVIKGDIENMDRAAHSIVYFGKEFAVPTSPLRRKFEEAVETHEALAANDAEISVFVNPILSAELSLDELVAVTMANWASKSKDGLAIYRSGGLVATPIIASIPMDECFIQLSKATTFAAVAATLNTTVTKVEDRDLLRQTLFYVKQIDRVLTRILNDFLQRMTDLNRLQITSFIEDAPGLSQYLNEKFKSKYNQLYIDYQKRILCSLFAHTKSANDAISVMTDYLEADHCDNLMLAYALTYISATAAELGYDVDSKPKTITAASSPMLRRLVEALSTYDAKRDDPPHHMVILADGTRYMLYQVADGQKVEYTLVEV